MKVVNVHSRVNVELCKGCKTCQMVCPVYAITVGKQGGKIDVAIDDKRCVGCWNCEQRCPEHAIEMAPCDPYRLETNVAQFDYKEIKALCRKARFHPKQVVCYCSSSRAEELAAAILGGAKTPDAVVLATGIGAGCGIECNQSIQRFLEAAGHTFERPKDSYQWYGRTLTIWEVDPSVKADYPVFRFDDDRELIDRVIDAPVRS
ncbi:MAG: 4Fe-4S dicluster domain-containing protein [Proteobacteria bacterium]|nr:4Fe-4S dicluster domain-containing protein [Pseudomonadota bacterium]